MTFPVSIAAGAAMLLLYKEKRSFQDCSLYILAFSLSYSSLCYFTSYQAEKKEYYSQAIIMSASAVFTKLACNYISSYYLPALAPFITSNAFCTIASCIIGSAPYIKGDYNVLIPLVIGFNQIALHSCIYIVKPLLGNAATILPASASMQIKTACDYAIHFYNQNGCDTALTSMICRYLTFQFCRGVKENNGRAISETKNSSVSIED